MKEVSMSANAEPRVEQAAFLDDIEKRVSEIFTAQKSEVEQSLIEKINREKEEAQKRIAAVNQEFAQIRGYLEEHKTVMAELQETEDHIRGDIRGHFERAVNYQKMMENAAGLAGDELERIGGLNKELERIRTRAEEGYANLKKHLSGYAGIIASIPAPAGKAEDVVNWTEELDKLRKVRDLLATLRRSEPSLAPAAAATASSEGQDEPTAPAAPEAEELAVSLGLIDVEDDSVKDDVEFAEGTPAPELIQEAAYSCYEAVPEAAAAVEPVASAEPEPVPAPEPETAAASADSQAILNALARYRRTEPVNNGIELGFFASEAAAVLDAESFMTTVGKVVDNANNLHGQLGQAASVKDLFLLKQEILNQQEVLRKVFFRVVRFCDKENGRLPEVLSEVISAQGMKDVIERLTMANWSDPSDFKPFLNELRSMKRAFEVRAASSASYLQSILDQVEGREN
jgi:DNA-binding protein H-NS